jgi:hypothetical protein
VRRSPKRKLHPPVLVLPPVILLIQFMEAVFSYSVGSMDKLLTVFQETAIAAVVATTTISGA